MWEELNFHWFYWIWSYLELIEHWKCIIESSSADNGDKESVWISFILISNLSLITCSGLYAVGLELMWSEINIERKR